MSRMGTLPEVTLKWAQTLDGQLADDDDQSQWISGIEERQYTHRLRSAHQAILVGAQTFLKDFCQLTVRDIKYEGLQPARVIIDPRGRIVKDLKNNPDLLVSLQMGPRRTYLLSDIFDDLNEMDIKYDTRKLIFINLPFKDFKQWLNEVLSQLSFVFQSTEGRQLHHLMVEGGAMTLSEFLKAGLVDRLEVAISPLILGGSRHRVNCGSLLKNAERFEIDSKEQLGVDILLRYKIKKPAILEQETT